MGIRPEGPKRDTPCPTPLCTSLSSSIARSSCSRPPSTVPAPCSSTPPSASAATPRRSSQRFPDLRYVGLDRDRDALALSAERLAPFAGPHPARPFRLRPHRGGAGRALDSGNCGRALRSRRLVDAARPRRAGLLLFEGRPARHADGRYGPADRGTGARRVRRVRAAADLLPVRRGEARPAVRPTRSSRDARRHPSRRRRSSSRSSTPRRRRRCDAPGIRRSGSSRPCASRSTRSSHRSSGRSRPRSTRSRSAGRIVVLAYQSLEDRIVKRELAARSASTAPRGLPVELPQHRPEFRLLVRGAELASDAEKAENPRATPVRLRAAEKLWDPADGATRRRGSVQRGTEEDGSMTATRKPRDRASAAPVADARAPATSPPRDRADPRTAPRPAAPRARRRHGRRDRRHPAGAAAAELRAGRRGVSDLRICRPISASCFVRSRRSTSASSCSARPRTSRQTPRRSGWSRAATRSSSTSRPGE